VEIISSLYFTTSEKYKIMITSPAQNTGSLLRRHKPIDALGQKRYYKDEIEDDASDKCFQTSLVKQLLTITYQVTAVKSLKKTKVP
jgi:hypothetical protein